MLVLEHGHGNVVALAEIPTFAKTSHSTNFPVQLICLVDKLSAASKSLNLILKFLFSLVQLQLRDRDALALIQLILLLRMYNLSVVAPDLTTVSVETSSSILIPAFAIQPIAHAVLIRLSLTPKYPERLA